jgi:hypothetical protein
VHRTGRLLAKKFNATQITAYDYTIRQRPFLPTKNENGVLIQLPPAQVLLDVSLPLPHRSTYQHNHSQQTHIDQNYWAAIARVRLHLGEDAAQRVLDGSARAIVCNVWRPLIGPLLEQPLAAADFRSLDKQRDFDETTPAPPGCRTGESQMLRYHPDQKWYFLSAIQTDECLLLKCFDSLTGVRSPHSVRARL